MPRSPRRRRRTSSRRRRRQDRAVDQRPVVAAVDGVRGLAGDADLAAHRLEEVEVRLDRALLVLDRAGEEVERVPAGDELQAVGVEGRLQRRRVGGHLVALLDAVEADLAGLAQALLERDVGAEGVVVVVGPGDGVGAVEDHRQSASRWSSRVRLVVLAGRAHLSRGRRPRGRPRPTRRRRPRWSASGRCR